MTKDQIIQCVRASGMTFHLGMPFEVVIEQLTRLVVLVEIEATVKATSMAAIAINEATAAHWAREADLLTQAIQHLNSNPYALTKEECIDVLKKLRDVRLQPQSPDVNGATNRDPEKICCEQCDDGDGNCVFPYYGVAPHTHAAGQVMGSTRILPRDKWGNNFAEDPDSPGQGTYLRCGACGRGACCA